MGAQEQAADARCDFCGKHESDGRSMVAGPGVYICNECVELAVEVLEKRGVTLNRYLSRNVGASDFVEKQQRGRSLRSGRHRLSSS